MRLGEQLEPHYRPRKRGGEIRKSGRDDKTWKRRYERRRARANPEAEQGYRRYCGYEY